MGLFFESTLTAYGKYPIQNKSKFKCITNISLYVIEVIFYTGEDILSTYNLRTNNVVYAINENSE